MKALRRTIQALRAAIKTKRTAQVPYMFSRARALIRALPAIQTKEQQEQLSLLRTKYRAGSKAAVVTTKKPKPKPKSRAGSGGKKPAAKSVPKPKPAAQATPVRELGDRFINRAVLGYSPADKR